MTAQVHSDREILDVLGPDGFARRHKWLRQCHAASIHLVKSGVLGFDARVARGFAKGVTSQHSWVVIGDPYDVDTPIVDPTLHHYDDSQPEVWFGTLKDGIHRPHGAGSIWEYGQPVSGGGDTIELPEPEDGWSAAASDFLGILGPLDVIGWQRLAHLPVEGWPSKEILTQMAQVPALKAFIPIDILGMATDLNPEGLYR